MSKLLLPLILIVIIACNSDPKGTSADAAAQKDDSTAKSFTWTGDEEKEFLADCVESAKAKVGDTVAYKQCNCVLKQLKQNFPSLDSANASADSTQLIMFANNCK